MSTWTVASLASLLQRFIIFTRIAKKHFSHETNILLIIILLLYFTNHLIINQSFQSFAELNLADKLE